MPGRRDLIVRTVRCLLFYLQWRTDSMSDLRTAVKMSFLTINLLSFLNSMSFHSRSHCSSTRCHLLLWIPIKRGRSHLSHFIIWAVSKMNSRQL